MYHNHRKIRRIALLFICLVMLAAMTACADLNVLLEQAAPANEDLKEESHEDQDSPKQEADVELSDDSSDFVLLSEAVPDAILEIRYYSTYNFVGDRIDGYPDERVFLSGA